MRDCGKCIVCCVYQRIDSPEFKKDAMVHCPHLELSEPIKRGRLQYTGASCLNCKAHGTDKRPKACVDYNCLWKNGFGNEEDRPDISLMLFDRSKGIENSIEAKPLKDRQEITIQGRQTIDRMSVSTKHPVIVLNFYERRIQRIVGRGL